MSTPLEWIGPDRSTSRWMSTTSPSPMRVLAVIRVEGDEHLVGRHRHRQAVDLTDRPAGRVDQQVTAMLDGLVDLLPDPSGPPPVGLDRPPHVLGGHRRATPRTGPVLRLAQQVGC